MSPYGQKFYDQSHQGSLSSAKKVVPLLVDLIGMKSVCDVGCGEGTWLSVFMEAGITDLIGVDGDYVQTDRLLFPRERFMSADLGKTLKVGRKFDAAISLEVAEHLPPARAAGFVQDLVALAPIVIFSAAVPGQDGTNHINEQWQQFWVDLFRDCGYEVFDPVRPAIWDDRSVTTYYRQNILVFCKTPPEGSQWKTPSKMELRIMHPDMVNDRLQMPSLKFLARSLFGSVNRAVKKRLR